MWRRVQSTNHQSFLFNNSCNNVNALIFCRFNSMGLLGKLRPIGHTLAKDRATKDDEMELRENKMAELHGLRILISGHDDGDDLVGALRILFVLLSRSHIIWTRTTEMENVSKIWLWQMRAISTWNMTWIFMLIEFYTKNYIVHAQVKCIRTCDVISPKQYKI